MQYAAHLRMHVTRLDRFLPRRPELSIGVALAAVSLAGSAGCERHEASSGGAPSVSESQKEPDSHWRTIDGSPQLVLPTDDASQEAIGEAIRKAKRTAGAAREKWVAAAPDERRRWAVMWAAPAVGSSYEYVWVEPITWSPFRIEGWLASPPQRELESGAALGDLVAFPADDLVDWLHLPANTHNGQGEGGFLIRALEDDPGPPEPDADRDEPAPPGS